MRRSVSVAWVLLVALLPSCRPSGSAVARAWNEWKAASPTDYIFDYAQSCFCFFETYNPVRIEVRAGRVVRVVPLDSAQLTNGPTADAPAANDLARYPTLDSVFAELLAIEADAPARLAITWDTAGYPSSVELDRIAAAVDDEWSMQISSFRRLD